MKATIIDINGFSGKRTVRLKDRSPNTIIVTDIKTCAVKVISITARRVMKRATALFKKGQSMGVTDVPFRFYLDYCWKLEKGHVWA